MMVAPAIPTAEEIADVAVERCGWHAAIVFPLREQQCGAGQIWWVLAVREPGSAEWEIVCVRRSRRELLLAIEASAAQGRADPAEKLNA